MHRRSILLRTFAVALLATAAFQACGTDMGPEVEGESPDDVSAAPTGPSSILVSWTPLDRTDVLGYQILRRTSFQGDFEAIDQVSSAATAHLDTQLDPETFYGYRVVGLLEQGRVTAPSVVAGARTAPAPGVVVEVTTDSPNPAFIDRDGYLVEILTGGGVPVASGVVAANDSRRFSPLTPGDYGVRISDVLSSCVLQSSSEVSVAVPGTGIETLVPAEFQVACKDPTRGEITANLALTGDTLLTANFTARLTGTVGDSAVSRPQGVIGGGATTFINLLPGQYQVELVGLPTACTQVDPDPAQPATISVAAGGAASLDFVVECLRTGGGDGVPLVARWTTAAGAPIGSAAIGTTVVLELAVELGDSASLQALQGSVTFDVGLLEYLPTQAADLDLGPVDDLDQFTGGSLSQNSINFQTFSLSSTANSGTQGVARLFFRTTTQGTARISFQTQVASSFPPVRTLVFALEAQPLTIGSSAPQPPVADVGGPYSGTVGAPISFDGGGSFDPDGGAIVSYAWTFGDGGSATGVAPTHTYSAAQTYMVKLTVTDDEQDSRTDSIAVLVSAPGSGPRITGGWTDASGNPVTTIGSGQTVRLEICATLSTVQAYQADLGYDSALVDLTALAELNASAARVAVCQGTGDVVDQFTRAPLGELSTNHQNYSITAAAGTGPQGLAVATFLTRANGVLQPTIALRAWANFGGGGPQPTVQLPALTIGTGGGSGASGPTADAGGPYVGSVTNPLSVDGSGSVAGSSPIQRYLWSFGDGTPVDSVSGVTTSHTYAAQGNYTIVLTARDQDGRADADTTTATIGPQSVPPFAWSNTWLPQNASPGAGVVLLASVNPGQPLASVRGKVRADPAVLRFDSIRGNPIWTFAFSGVAEGNGVIAISGSASQPSQGGVPLEVARLFYTVVGANGSGLTTQTSNVILLDPALRPLSLTGLAVQESTFSVGAPNVLPVARANGPYTGVAGVRVSFAATGSNDPDGSIVAFTWDFGDGTTGTGAAPQHTYDIVGPYQAILTVRDNRGTIDRDTTVVNVLEPATHAWKSAWMRLLQAGPPVQGPMLAPLQTRPDSAGPGDRVRLEITARPGSAFQRAAGTVVWDSLVVRFDSVTAGPFSTGSFQATPGPASLTISAVSSATVPGTAPALLATAYFTVNASEGSSTVTTSSGVVLRDAAQSPLNITNLPILESTLFVAECCDPDLAPVADAGGPYGASPASPVAFSGAGSSGTISSYSWTFGDGGTGTGVGPSHTYAAAGVYQVTLTVANSLGASDVDTTTVTIAPPPVAEAGAAYSGSVGNPIVFNGSGSSGAVTSYAWAFGDGGTGTGVSPSHAYATSGTFEVVLVATGPGGSDADTTTASVNIAAVADAGGPYADTLGATFTFDGSGSSGATSYSWNFGDGNTATGVSPTHAYTSAGAYRVVLTATGPGGVDADTTLAAVGNILGGWTTQAGIPITAASVGQTVVLEVCTNVATTQAFQARMGHDGAIATRSNAGDLDASTAGVVLCQGPNDVVDQFSGGTANPLDVQTYSISPAAGIGPQGIVRATFLIVGGAGTTFDVAFPLLQVWSKFGGAPAPAQIQSAIPGLAISP
jgi:PKD repeat protein